MEEGGRHENRSRRREGEDGRVGGRGSDVDLTFIPFSLIFLISSVGFSANRMKCHYYAAHRRANHSIVTKHLSSRLLSLQCLFLVGGPT